MRRNLAGERFGRLTAVEYAERRGNQAAWRCVRDCGTERIVLPGNLRAGHTRSCGCIRGARTTGGRNKGHAGKYAEPPRPLDPVTYALRKRRYEMDLTQAHVARIMGWDQRSLCAAEVGKIAPTFGFVTAWAQALGMKLELRAMIEGE